MGSSSRSTRGLWSGARSVALALLPESVGGGREGPQLIESGNPKLVLPLDELGDDVEVAIHHGVDGRDELLRVGKHEHSQRNQDGGDALEDLGGRELDLRCLLEAFCDCSIGGAGVVGVVGHDCFLVTSRSRWGSYLRGYAKYTKHLLGCQTKRALVFSDRPTTCARWVRIASSESVLFSELFYEIRHAAWVFDVIGVGLRCHRKRRPFRLGCGGRATPSRCCHIASRTLSRRRTQRRHDRLNRRSSRRSGWHADRLLRPLYLHRSWSRLNISVWATGTAP